MASQSTIDGEEPVRVARYSSADQPPQDRYAEWREGSLLAFGRLYDTKPQEPFQVETASVQLGAIGFSHSRMTGQRWERGLDHVRGDEVDPLMVAIRFEGHGYGDANGRDFVAPPGSVVLSDFAQPQSYMSDTAHTAVLSIPRTVAERILPRVRTLHGLVLPPPSALLLRSHARALIETIDMGMQMRHAERLGSMALDLLEIGIARSMAGGPLSPGAAATGARLAAEAAIERRLGSPSLSVAELCRVAGVSRSALYQLFELEGGVYAYIRDRRLSRVAAELARGGHERIARIAERWGFNDPARLSRQFKAKFGHSPSEHRERHHRPPEEPGAGR